jgi:hypothetical protein
MQVTRKIASCNRAFKDGNNVDKKHTNLAAYFQHPRDQDLELLPQPHLQQGMDYSKQRLKHLKIHKIHF